MFKWLIGTIFGVFLGILVYFVWYLGAFKPVDLIEKPYGPLILIYKVHVGPYHKIVGALDEVSKWAKENHIACDRTFGEFLDNPNTVEEGRLRANCGCVIEGAAIPASVALPEGFFSREVPSKKYVTVEYAGSPGIGPLRVYPKVTEYFDAKHAVIAGAVLEIYKVISAKEMITTYLFPME